MPVSRTTTFEDDDLLLDIADPAAVTRYTPSTSQGRAARSTFQVAALPSGFVEIEVDRSTMMDTITALRHPGPGAFAGAARDDRHRTRKSRIPTTGTTISYRAGVPADYERDCICRGDLSVADDSRHPQRANTSGRSATLLRDHKTALGALVSLEMGKIAAEGEGEVRR